MSDDEIVFNHNLLYKHIENKINPVFKRKFGQSKSNREDDNVDKCSESSGTIGSVRGNIVPSFDPDDQSATIKNFL